MSELFLLGPERIAALFEVPDSRQYLAFEQYYKLCLILERVFYSQDKIDLLEIGSGYSTGLFALFSQYLLSKKKKFRAISMDFNFEIFESLKIYKYGNIECIKGSTISNKELSDFYYNDGLNSFIGEKKISDLLVSNFFCKAVVDARKMHYWLERENVCDLPRLTEDCSKNLSLYQKMVDYYSYSGSLDSDIHLLENELGTCKNLSAHSFDAIFFDGGELTSNIEFNNLLPLVSVGGVVALHDIWFPKSFKNWLCASFLRQSLDWECLYIDESTPQGMAVFQKILNSDAQ